MDQFNNFGFSSSPITNKGGYNTSIQSFRDSTASMFTNVNDKKILLIVIVCFIFVIVLIKLGKGNFKVIKFLNNTIVQTILIITMCILLYYKWNQNKTISIISLVLMCALFYVIKDDVESTENFTGYLQNHSPPPPEFDVRGSQVPYCGAGCHHRTNDPCNDADDSKQFIYHMDDQGSPDMQRMVDTQNGMLDQYIGADLTAEGDDFDLKMQKLTFGQAFNRNPMYTMNARDFLISNNNNNNGKSNSQTVENKLKMLNNDIFDARDMSETTNRGKRLAGIQANRCSDVACMKPRIMI